MNKKNIIQKESLQIENKYSKPILGVREKKGKKNLPFFSLDARWVFPEINIHLMGTLVKYQSIKDLYH